MLTCPDNNTADSTGAAESRSKPRRHVLSSCTPTHTPRIPHPYPTHTPRIPRARTHTRQQASERTIVVAVAAMVIDILLVAAVMIVMVAVEMSVVPTNIESALQRQPLFLPPRSRIAIHMHIYSDAVCSYQSCAAAYCHTCIHSLGSSQHCYLFIIYSYYYLLLLFLLLLLSLLFLFLLCCFCVSR